MSKEFRLPLIIRNENIAARIAKLLDGGGLPDAVLGGS